MKNITEGSADYGYRGRRVKVRLALLKGLSQNDTFWLAWSATGTIPESAVLCIMQYDPSIAVSVVAGCLLPKWPRISTDFLRMSLTQGEILPFICFYLRRPWHCPYQPNWSSLVPQTPSHRKFALHVVRRKATSPRHSGSSDAWKRVLYPQR
jgi:hypothetical protein